MSIENNLKRIADALETLVSKLDHIGQSVVVDTEAVLEQTAPAQEEATTSKAPPPPPETAAPSFTEASTQTVLTPEALNEALVAESSRLGGPDKIFAMIEEKFGTKSITDVDASRYQELLDAAKALQ